MIKETLPTLKALNYWTLKQKILDHTTRKASTIQLLQRIDIYDNASGRLVKSTGTMKSHSFVMQFLQILEGLIAHSYGVVSDQVSTLDTSNTSRLTPGSNVNNSTVCCVEAPANTSLYGIQIGTGTTAPATTDYAVQTIIAHGVGASKMQWGACGVSTAAVVGANVDLTITRAFVNSSGGAITIREITLVCSEVYSSTTQGYFCLSRDAVNQAVANAQTAVVTYVIRTTV